MPSINPLKKEFFAPRAQQSLRLNLLAGIIIALSAVLILRLAYLQFAQFNRYKTLSLKNQMSIIPIAPPRGIILDRNGLVLAENVPVYMLEIIPGHVKDITHTIRRLQQLLPSISKEDIVNFNKARRQNRPFVPIPIKLKLTQEEVAIFAGKQYQFPGVNIRARLMRFYPFGEVTAHLLGYIGRINTQELKRVDHGNYRATNFIGKAGIEKFYESILHGRVGYQQIETDVSGRTVRVVSKQNPISGPKLYLTLDANLQKAAYAALDNRRGAIVAMSTRNGDILAMVSAPSFDPNLFVNGISSKNYRKLTSATDKPLYNRAIRGLYPPGSTIKPFIALAGLNKGVIDAHYRIYDPGWFRLPGVVRPYRDHKRTGHGIINLQRAITVSCDTYFYQLGYKMGIGAMEDLLVQFGFGQLSHVDLPEEAPGLMPNKQWKAQTKGMSWYPGDTVIASIGQGFMLASPLQLANAVAALSQKGQRFRPHLLQKALYGDQDKIYNYHALEEYPIRLKHHDYWDTVIASMRAVITSHEGTGYRFGRDAPFSVAAKTGTIQVFGGNQYEKTRYLNYKDIPEHLRDHSSFIAFAPVEKPTIAIAVLVENDFSAAIIARKVLDAYFANTGETLHANNTKSSDISSHP